MNRIENKVGLAGFPAPPEGAVGWPWNGRLNADRTCKAIRDIPKISVVTPSYNQGQFLEETIRSVILQAYPNVEFIVIDGGSSDNSVEIIRKYDRWIDYWVSERDRGQPHALNKGFSRCTGDIYFWINSDDVLHENCFWKVATRWLERDRDLFWCAFGVDCFGSALSKGFVANTQEGLTLSQLLKRDVSVHAAGCFWDARFRQKLGDFDESLHYAFDKDFWLRIIRAGHSLDVDHEYVAAGYRFHDESKSVSARLGFLREFSLLGLRYGKDAGATAAEVAEFNKTLSYASVRLAQGAGATRNRRFRLLQEAAYADPSSVLRRDWVATAFRSIFGK